MTDESNDNAMDVERVRSLVELMIEHGLTEIDLRQHGSTIRLKRDLPTVASQTAAPIAMPVAVPSPAPSGQGAAGSQEDDADLLVIKSPMVGTFYSRANPESEPFVQVGAKVSTTTTVCIIEAMKVFNEIAAEVAGTIVEILVEDEEPVEFGKPLMKVRPN